MSADHYRISQTAILCADARALCTDMPFVKEVFEEVSENSEGRMSGLMSHWMRKVFLRVPFLKSKVAKVSLLEGRYYANNEAIARFFDDDTPILEIAAGLSPRALHLSGTRTYLETDLQDLIDQKARISGAVLKRLGRQASTTLNRLALNALDYDQLRAAAQSIRAVEPTKPFVVLHEGLTMYFDDGEQAQFRDNMRKLLKEENPNGAWITTDFSLRDSNKSVLRHMMSKLEKNTGRSFNYFESDAEVSAFLKHGGLKVQFIANEHIARSLSCIRKIGLAEKDVLAHAHEYRAAIITLRDNLQ